ncbi:hypothetical protein A6A03_09820 [Chloroflexus islandicus]|uniref:Uncharacterized protein n=1 Tax=Chloroflexus islandicus TaxID=1707952 RepID=A0A178MFL7_9CHLR|nr:hypothetical protein [Chloroflexus islandicus]OAN47541.1 hypothetical protein A6A03_09820 [Chloroflexus islandicus]
MNLEPTTLLFPTLPARNLNGRTLTLPAEFGGAFNIAIIAFRRWHQALVDSWFTFLNPLLAAHPTLRAYELPIIGRQYILARPFIDGGMAFAIPDPAVRNRTLTVYTDVQQVVTALQIASTETITLLLVDRTGRIFWRDTGPYTAERAAGLEQTLATLLQ